MTKPFVLYTAAWIAGRLVAALPDGAPSHDAPSSFEPGPTGGSLLQDWKVFSFVAAPTGPTLVAPYADDATWDYVDAFRDVGADVRHGARGSSAPCNRVLRRCTAWAQGYIAVCLWLFSASWFYDLYIFLRDGAYSPYWLPNLFLSSLLYLSAGLMW